MTLGQLIDYLEKMLGECEAAARYKTADNYLLVRDEETRIELLTAILHYIRSESEPSDLTNEGPSDYSC